ncbi:hypothetical protein Bca4012_030016 [Brassica carinata]
MREDNILFSFENPFTKFEKLSNKVLSVSLSLSAIKKAIVPFTVKSSFPSGETPSSVSDITGTEGPMFSSGMCTEVFQFDVSTTSGAIIPASPAANAITPASPAANAITPASPAANVSSEHMLVDPREGGDGDIDGMIGGPNSLSRVFVVVLVDSAKFFPRIFDEKEEEFGEEKLSLEFGLQLLNGMYLLETPKDEQVEIIWLLLLELHHSTEETTTAAESEHHDHHALLSECNGDELQRERWRRKDDFTAKEKKNRDGLHSSSSAMTEADQVVR